MSDQENSIKGESGQGKGSHASWKCVTQASWLQSQALCRLFTCREAGKGPKKSTDQSKKERKERKWEEKVRFKIGQCGVSGLTEKIGICSSDAAFSCVRNLAGLCCNLVQVTLLLVIDRNVGVLPGHLVVVFCWGSVGAVLEAVKGATECLRGAAPVKS